MPPERGQRALHVLTAVVALTAAAGCAALTCQPLTIIVADKDERIRLESRPRGIRVDALGRVVEVREDVVVHDFWVRATDSRWYRVSPPDFSSAQIGEPLTVCR